MTRDSTLRALELSSACLPGAFLSILQKRIGNGDPRTGMICPQCRSADCFRSHRDGVADFVTTFAGLRPWRCHTCDYRFYSWRVALIFSYYAHCAKCGNFDLEYISRERVEQGTLMTLKRWLGIPAYRCDACRRRFFSVLPFRRILPSTDPAYSRRSSPDSKQTSQTFRASGS
jgi:hypothetical protein